MDKSFPYWSTIVTFSSFNPGTDDETKCVIAFTCDAPNARPSKSWTNTDAVTGAVSLTKTDFSGIAKWTLAELIPEIWFTDLANSASRDCFILNLPRMNSGFGIHHPLVSDALLYGN